MKKQDLEKQSKTRWHILLSKMLEEILRPVGIEVHTDFDIMSEPPKADILLIKRTRGKWLPEQLDRLPDGIRSSRAKHILLEFKYTESVNGDVFEQALCYKRFYRKTRKLKTDDVQMFLLSSKTTGKATLKRFGYSLSETPGVYLSDNPFVEKIPLLSLNELTNKPCNAFLKCFASRVKEKEKAFSLLERWKSGIDSHDFWRFVQGLCKICLIKGGDDMKEITPETLIEMGKEIEALFLATLPIEKRLEGLDPKDIFKRYKPKERLEGLKPKERLEGLKPKERLEGLKPEEIEALLQKYKKKAK